MCLAVPMKIIEVRDDKTGVAELDGSRHEVNLSLVPDAGIGAYIIVHAGFAIERMNEHEAQTILSVFAEIAEWQKNAAESAPTPQPSPLNGEGVKA
jgi:hydrogenase expression/formation protein HypC